MQMHLCRQLEALTLIPLHVQAFYKAILALVAIVKWWQLGALRQVEQR
jgi:hypothetical protein